MPQLVAGSSGVGKQCDSVEIGLDLPGGDLRRQCVDDVPFAPCTVASATECLQHCARRSRCFAYVYSTLKNTCHLKSASVAIFGKRINAYGVHLGRCIARMPTVRSTAVCLSGQPRGFGLAASSVRTNVLDPWDADAFLVAQLHHQSNRERSLYEFSQIQMGKAGLGPRLRMVVQRTDRETLGPDMYEQVLQRWSASKVPRGPNVGGSGGYKGWILQLLNREACLHTVLHAEVASGARYSIYARVRLDSVFFAPLPSSILEAASTSTVAVVPAGDAWGARGGGVCDRMLVGGYRAFEADARLWVTFRDNPGQIIVPGYVTETATRAHLSFHGVKVQTVPVAYCTVNQVGACRYPEHLSISLSVVGAELLQSHPWLCHCNETKWCNLLEPRTCDPSRDRFVQTEATKVSDPNFCKLSRACRATQQSSFSGLAI